jgi:hypothetical protein
VYGNVGQITPSGLKYAIVTHVIPSSIEYYNETPSPTRSGPSQGELCPCIENFNQNDIMQSVVTLKGTVVNILGIGTLPPIHICILSGPGPQGFVKSTPVVATQPVPGVPSLKSLFINEPHSPLAHKLTLSPAHIIVSLAYVVIWHCPDKFSVKYNINLIKISKLIKNLFFNIFLFLCKLIKNLFIRHTKSMKV